MAKIILGFLAIFALIFVGIDVFIKASGREKLQFAKALGYSFLCSVITVIVISTIVILF